MYMWIFWKNRDYLRHTVTSHHGSTVRPLHNRSVCKNSLFLTTYVLHVSPDVYSHMYIIILYNDCTGYNSSKLVTVADTAGRDHGMGFVAKRSILLYSLHLA